MKKIAIYGIFCLFLGAALWIGLNWKSILSFPRILPSFSAKEFCTCYFVNGQTEPYCRELVRQYFPLKDLHINSELKEIYARGFTTHKTARFVNERFGCQLVN